MSKLTAKNVEFESTPPAPAAPKPAPFEPGGERRALVQPRAQESIYAPGMWVAVPKETEFNVTPDLVEESVYVFRPVGNPLAPFAAFGLDVATVDSEYTFTAYGDGTATLNCGCFVQGSVVYLPSNRFEDQGAFSMDNAGFWKVERVRAGTAFMRRLGGGVGVTETVKAKAASDIQTALGPDSLVACVVGPLTGVFKVAYATPRWLALSIPQSLTEMEAVTFDQFIVAYAYMANVAIEVDQAACVRVPGKEGFIVLPRAAGIESEMGRMEIEGFTTALDIENLSSQPMKLRATYRLGK